MAELNKDSKVKLFTHTDLDGAGCAVVARVAFYNVDVVYCDYHNVDEKVRDFIESDDHKNYSHVFITDISVSKEVASLIEDRKEEVEFKLLDHHPTAQSLNNYPWAFVSPASTRGKNSGTNMLFEYLFMSEVIDSRLIYYDALTVFVEKVRRYDSWEWKELYDDNEASSLNDLFWLYGIDKFVDAYAKRILNLEICIVSNGSWIKMFNKTDLAVLDVDYSKKVKYINRKDKQLISGKLVGKNVGFVFAEQYISELGNELSDRHPELDFIVIIDLGNKRVSYRTVKDNIDLGKDVASNFGGGGHPKASGSQIEIDSVKMVIPMLFGSKKLINRLVSVVNRKGFLGKVVKILDRFGK